MKKIILLLLITLIFLSCATRLVQSVEYREVPAIEDLSNYRKQYFTVDTYSFEEMEKDLETFLYLIKNTYVGYDTAKENGLDVDNCINTIKSHFINKNVVSKSEVVEKIYDAFKEYFNDSHFRVQFGDTQKIFINHYDLYFTNVYVRKKGKSYEVLQSDNKNVRVGEIIKCKKENLLYYINDGIECYRLGVLSNKKEEFINVVLDGKEIRILVYNNTILNSKDFCYIEKQTNDSIYFAINSFFVQAGKNDTYETFKKFVETSVVAKEKKNVIINLKGNYGGDSSIFAFFLQYLCGYEDLLYADVFSNEEYRTLDSPSGMYAMCRYVELNYPIDDVRERFHFYFDGLEKQKENPHRSYVEFEPKKTQLAKPKFYGNLIILADKETASSGEDAIKQARILLEKTDQVICIGENTNGALSYGNVCMFRLPESGIVVFMPITDWSSGLKKYENFGGEGVGFYPDIWSTNENLNDSIFHVTQDKEMYEILKDYLK